jgi:hypothetical protein
MRIEIEQYVETECRMTLSAENQAEVFQLREILKAARNRGMSVQLSDPKGVEFCIPAKSA